MCVDGYAFMGSLIIQEVVKDLLNKGLDNAKVLLLAGSRYVHMSVWEFKILYISFLFLYRYQYENVIFLCAVPVVLGSC